MPFLPTFCGFTPRICFGIYSQVILRRSAGSRFLSPLKLTTKKLAVTGECVYHPNTERAIFSEPGVVRRFVLPSRRKTHSKQSNISPPAVAVPAPSEQHFISCSAVVHTIFGTNYPFTSLTLNIPNFVISELIDHLPAPRYMLIEHTFYFRRSHLYHL